MTRTLTDSKNIVMTTTDYARLRAVIAEHAAAKNGSAWQFELLERELNRTRLLPSNEIPPNVVTMNSTVRVRGGSRDAADTWTIVYPQDTDLDQGRISIFSPMAMAILGYRVGDEVSWEVPAGRRRYSIEEIVYQPEANGRFDL
jgi:regulator of nucleoside diphosphate kinase